MKAIVSFSRTAAINSPFVELILRALTQKRAFINKKFLYLWHSAIKILTSFWTKKNCSSVWPVFVIFVLKWFIDYVLKEPLRVFFCGRIYDSKKILKYLCIRNSIKILMEMDYVISISLILIIILKNMKNLMKDHKSLKMERLFIMTKRKLDLQDKA